MKTKIILVALLCLAGCGDRFRYECQDSANWDSPQCQKPACEITRTCPDLIIKTDKRISTPAPEVKVEKKGDCK
jgi:hypothetical protein